MKRNLSKHLPCICLSIVGLCLSLLGRADAASAEISLLGTPFERGRLAFSYSDGGKKDIYVIDFEEKSIKPLIASDALDEFPSWSPDGSKLAFYSDSSGDREIYVANFDGSEITQLTTSPGPDEDPDWSPDGKQLVFHSARQGKGYNLYIMNADGSSPRALTNSKSKNTVPRWSPRGNEIIYSTNAKWPGWDLMLYRIRTKEHTPLTSGYRSFCRASWNKDGSRFIFSHGIGDEINLWMQTKGESKPIKLTTRPGREYDAIWSDDERFIFFVGESAPGVGDFQVFVLDLLSKNSKQLTQNSGAIRHLSWNSLPTPTALQSQIQVDSGSSARNKK